MRVQIFENRPGTPLPPENAVMFATTEANARHFFRPPCLSKMNNLDRIDVIALSTGDSNITTSSNNLEEIDRLPLYYRDFGIKDCLSLSLNDIYSGNDNLHDDDDEYLEIYRNLKTPLQDSPQQPGVFSRSARKVIIMLKFLSSINKSQQDGMVSSDSSLSIPIDTD
ncbi:hypothetical protein GQR58_029423 [Nymphon striatum]|nr:hypothetical protein GQR58_029423 [Nymphon striatum]